MHALTHSLTALSLARKYAKLPSPSTPTTEVSSNFPFPSEKFIVARWGSFLNIKIVSTLITPESSRITNHNDGVSE
jgi:hypothetical protein